jgi:hypothetical protein
MNCLRLLIALLAFIQSTAEAAPPSRPKSPSGNEPPHMVAENRFKTPEEVVKHYAERDSWGFIWTGWAKDERTALSMWQSSPLPETVYLIRGYEILPAKPQGDSVRVEVLYDMIVSTDGQGTLIEKGPKSKRVIYTLKKTRGVWKIESPSPLKQPAFVRPERYPIPLPPGVKFP